MLHEFSMGTHIGTHVDAPSHMIEGGKNIDEYSLERFVVDAVCIDVRSGFDAETIRQNVKAGSGVLFYTATEEYYQEERYFNEFPILDEESIRALVDIKPSFIGLDACGVDIDESFPVHITLLGADILIIENLTNLEQLVGKNFKLYAAPLALPTDGAPARVYAEVY